MLSISLRTLRSRWATFAGSFVALALGAALIATMGSALAAGQDAPDRRPERFAAAPVVVRGPDTLRVPSPIGDLVRDLDQSRPVPASLERELASLGRTVEDRSFPVKATGAPAELVGHPWSTAAFGPYRLTGGRAPRAADEAVATGDWTAPGRRVRTDRGTVRIVGTVADRGFEHALFFTDARAALLAPRADQLVVSADAGAVREKTAGVPGVRVLTGDARAAADADPDRDADALVAVNAMLGTAAGITGFVSVFVVASTFAFAVAQRRREFGLLRTAGATAGQVRWMVCAEGLLVGAAASATGCALGAWWAPQLARRLVDGGVAPRWFAIGDASWPYHLAFWTGLSVALCGVLAASWRAGRTGPTDALREAAVDSATMTWGRAAFGASLLLTGLGLLGWALLTDPGELLHRKTYLTRPMVLITACALLAPVLVGPLTRTLGRLTTRFPGAGAMLVRENAAAGVRRTAAVAAPVLVMVALAGSLLGTTATLNEAEAAQLRERTAADFVISGAGDAGFGSATVGRLRRIPGTVVSASSAGAVFVLEDHTALIRSAARAADPASLARTARLPVVDGSVNDLDDGSIIVNEEWQVHTVGRTVDIWRGDGTRTSLRVAAVMRTGTGDNGVYVTPHNAAGAPVDQVDVKLTAGADTAAVSAGLRQAVTGTGARVFTKDQWIQASYPQTNRTTRLGLLVVLGIALLYTGIALANTLVMATSDRARELGMLRLAGATDGQVLRLVAAEALAVVGVGVVLGALVAGINLAGLWSALGLLHVTTKVVIPWAVLGGTVGVSALLAVVSSVVPAALALRRGPVEQAGTRE